jgi:CheY-like chemotaxis protein
LDVCHRLKTNPQWKPVPPQWKPVPVVMVTALNAKSMQNQCKRGSGAMSFTGCE